MGIKTYIKNPSNQAPTKANLTEKYSTERAYRQDRLAEKWSRVPEVGRGIEDMDPRTARNLAQLLENQLRSMSRMTEAQLSNDFYGFTPENMLRLIRLSYPNSIRGMVFTEFAMETMHDSIKYMFPRYTNAQRNDFDWDNSAYQDGKGWNGTDWPMDQKFDDPANVDDVMYESSESRYATELVNAGNVKFAGGKVTVTFAGGAFGDDGKSFIDGHGSLYVVINKKRVALAVQDETGAWFGGKDIVVGMDETDPTAPEPLKVQVSAIDHVAVNEYEFTLTGDGLSEITQDKLLAVGRYDSEKDLTGKYLGEVELVMKDYHFRPRPIALGVTWTHMAELNLDSAFGVSAEEMLLDSASQEIKKTLDYQAVKQAADSQATRAGDQFVRFNAEAADDHDVKDSYYHTAQLVGQAINRVGDLLYKKIKRGGVTTMIGGPGAVQYLGLNKAWSETGKQPALGAYKAGELGGIGVFKVPDDLGIGDNELLTIWKNPTVESDVAMAIGTLIPFYSTGVLQRKNFYKEAGIARYEDSQVLNPLYMGRIAINNIRELVY